MKKIAALRYYKDLKIWCTITVGVIVLLSCSAEGERAVITITNKEIHLDAEGAQSQKIQIISNTEWEIKSNEANWLYINKGTNKGDTATVFITASPNTGLQRSSRISIINEELPERGIMLLTILFSLKYMTPGQKGKPIPMVSTWDVTEYIDGKILSTLLMYGGNMPS